MARQTLPEGVAVVTGAVGGMGSAIARKLLAEGWRQLLLCDVDAERLDSLAAELRQAGADTFTLAGDVAAVEFPAQLVAALNGQPVSALVHTAGLSPSMDSAERILAVNLDASVRLVDAVRDHMADGSAAILFASNSSYFPMSPEATEAFTQPLPEGGALALLHLVPDSARAYVLSKLGVRALVKREAHAFAKRGARIASLSPGAVVTRMTELETGGVMEQMVERSASGRLGRPEELAAVAVFMCSPAASFVTAVDWLVDGGHTAGMGF